MNQYTTLKKDVDDSLARYFEAQKKYFEADCNDSNLKNDLEIASLAYQKALLVFNSYDPRADM